MIHHKSIEELDLRHITKGLQSLFAHHPPHGYLRGKTAMRNAMEQLLECSELEAEELVDTLESRGFLHFEGNPRGPAEADSVWSMDTHRRE